MKPISLKKIAEKFVALYYPQRLSRVDAIWEKLCEADFIKIKSVTTTSQYRIGEGLAFAGGAKPEVKEMITGIAIFAYTYQGIKNCKNIKDVDLRKQIVTTCMNHKIAPNLQKKLENVLSAMLPSMTAESIMHEKQNHKAVEKKSEYTIFLSRPSGIGVIKEDDKEEGIQKKYLEKKDSYDIFVYEQAVYKKVIESEKVKMITVNPSISFLGLVILFLKYKDIPLPYVEMYHKAFCETAEYNEHAKIPSDVMNTLKNAVKDLRNEFEYIKGFNIPRAKNFHYVCEGDFKFYVVLKKTTDQRYTLEGV